LINNDLAFFVAATGLEPMTFGLCLLLQFSLLPTISEFVVWTFSSSFSISRLSDVCH
jgi:hypothetical protein